MGINIIDTHAHLYAAEFDSDREAMLQRAKESGISAVVLPNVDSSTLQGMLNLEAAYPGYCFAAIGVHPTSIDDNYEQELAIVEKELQRRNYVAIGEIGTDMYWDKKWRKQQLEAFSIQLQWSLDYKLPVIIHVRDSFDETFEVMEHFRGKGLKGVFHSFTGNEQQADTIFGLGSFYLGINGILTFKNSGLREVVGNLPLDRMVLETDSPYLTPAPYRGKRNESSRIQLVADALAEIYQKTTDEVAAITTCNAKKLFQFAQQV